MLLNESLLVRIAMVFLPNVFDLFIALILPVGLVRDVGSDELASKISRCFGDDLVNDIRVLRANAVKVRIESEVLCYDINGQLN